MVGVWPEDVTGDLKGEEGSAEPIQCLTRLASMCCVHPDAYTAVPRRFALIRYHRIVDLTEIKIVDARWRPMFLMHSDDRPIGKDSIVRFIVLDT